LLVFEAEPTLECSRVEPPVAKASGPERRGDGKGAPVLGAAKRTLAVEHRPGIEPTSTGGDAGTRSRW
jgi:hypothetical protein